MAELNLIPYELKAKKQKKSKQLKIISIISICAAVLLLGILVPKAYLQFLDNKESLINAKISSNKDIVDEKTKMDNEIQQYTSYNNKVQKLIKEKPLIKDKIQNLEKYIPKDIYFSDLTYSEGVITINGTASDFNSINVFAANLEMSQQYSNAKINLINKTDSSLNGSQGNFQFTINIKF